MRWAVTFGQRFRTDDHPTFLPAHPDGYVVIDVPETMAVPGEIAARLAAFALLGSQWSFLYDETQVQQGFVAMFPRGQIGLIAWTSGSGWQFVEPHTILGSPPDDPERCWCKIRSDHPCNALELTPDEQEASRQRWLNGPLTDPPYGEGP